MKDILLEDEPVPPASSKSEGPGRPSMAMVSCMIRPESLEFVKEALGQIQGVGGITVTEVRGFGRQKGQVEHYRGGEYTLRFLPKVKLDVVVRKNDVDTVLAAIGQAARTGQVGDGKAVVVDVLNVIRIRTGEQGTVAL